MSDLYDDVLHLPPLGRSDHQCLLIHPKVRTKIKSATRRVRLMKPENVSALGLKINMEEWTPVFSAHDVDENVNLFTATLLGVLDDTLPECTVRVHPTDKPWTTPRIKKNIKARQRPYTIGDNDKYNQLCNKVSKLIEKAKESYYRSKVFATQTQRNGIG